MASFEDFCAACHANRPRTAIVLGSGLSRFVEQIRVMDEIRFADVPGLVSPTVPGHNGRVVLGMCLKLPVLLFLGRIHFYEGLPWDRVTALVQLAAQIGAKRLILSNAAGGIRKDLNPGDLMHIAGHLEILNGEDWKRIAAHSGPSIPDQIFSPKWNQLLLDLDISSGIYAGLTGPCYETPAEIRALSAMGADAVGMSTVREARVGQELGMQVIGISCITNKAAGLAQGTLSHDDVQEVATRSDVLERFAEVMKRLILLP